METTVAAHGKRAPLRPWVAVLLGLAVSIPFHVALLLILFLIRVPVPESVADEAPIQVAIVPMERIEQVGNAPEEGPPEGMRVEVPTPAVTHARAEAPGLSDSEADALGESEASLGLSAPGFAGGGGGGGGALAGTQFFGIAGTGRRIAFLVDKSGSMSRIADRDASGRRRQQPAGARPGQPIPHRLDRAQAELLRAIRALPDYAEVCVVFFDDAKVTNPDSPCFLRTTAANVGALEAWIGHVEPGGGTQPAAAFDHVMNACGGRPDLVYLLSDGEIEEAQLERMLIENRAGRPATINCIAFGGEVDSTRLRELAIQSGGVFRAVRPEGP